MITIESLIAVISLVLTAFGLGYTIGSNTKNNRPSLAILAVIFTNKMLGEPSIGIAFSYLL